MNQGSIWHIWDFHLHSPHSVLNNQFGDPSNEETWERYISEIETRAAEKDIAAIAITDYFCIEGHKKVRQYQERGRLKGLLIFPNIEFRIDKIVYSSRSSNSGKRLNFHVLFSPDIPPDLIEEQFLRNLDFVYQDEPFDNGERRKLTLSNLKEFGQSLQGQHAKFQSKSALEVGMMNAVVDPGKIKEILGGDSRFAGEYLLVLAEENLSLMSWNGQDHAMRKHLLQMAHAVFSANPNTRDFLLGKNHPSLQDYLNEFKSQKPCIWGCDAHGFEHRFLEPDKGRYCWIKSELSWEGLKQILYEPEERVRIQPNSPEPQKSIYTLRSIQIEKTQLNDTLCIDGIDIPLNANLVAIIGGRGSGKTALLDLIARCFHEGEKLESLEHSFFFRIRSKHSQPVQVTVRFKSGDEIAKEVGQDNIFFEKSDVIYLTQNHLDEYTADPAKLYGHIIDIVFGQDNEKRQEYERFEDQIKEKLKQIQELNLKIAQLREEVENNLPKEEKRLKQKQGELEDYKRRLEEYEAQQAGRGKEAEELTALLKILKDRRNKLIALSERFEDFEKKISRFRDQYALDTQSINAQLDGLDLPLKPLPPLLNDLDRLSEIISENTRIIEDKLPNIKKQIAEIQEQVGKLSGIESVIADLHRTINNLADEIKASQRQINTLDKKKGHIDELDQERMGIYADALNIAFEQRIYLQKMIEQFDRVQERLLSDLSFESTIDTSGRMDYIQRIASKADRRSHSEREIADLFNPIIEDANSNLNSSEVETANKESFLQIAKRLRKSAANVRLKLSVMESEFFNDIFSRFFRIGLRIKFKNRPLESLSMGERAVVLLKILVGLDDKPLLIDQPEEHLDNRYIYDELVPAFRYAKTKRQIIIATHNANLVVNTDAEQIVVAEYSDGVITYKTGALEDLSIRESIKTILEGGEQAFRKREEKYGYLF